MIPSRIEQTVEQYHMLQNGDTVAVGVSGGADSMCLLYWLLSVREKFNLKLLALHVEHGIRGEASKEDCAFVRAYCEANGVEFRSLSIDAVKEAAEAGLGVEEYSRERRYAFFESVNADKIATAHNATDNAETVLFRLARGTGIKGACGIPYVRGKIIRPLLDCPAEEIRQYCREQGIAYRTDETNADNAYSRNKIRNLVLPALRDVNSDLETAFGRFIRSAAEADAYVDETAEAQFGASFSKGMLPVEALRSAHPAVAKRAIVRLLAGAGYVPDEQHLCDVLQLAHHPGRVQLKGSLFAVADGQNLRAAVFDNLPEPSFMIKKSVVSASKFANKANEYKKEFAFYCDCDKINGDLSVRARAEGDSLRPAGRDVTKSLKKLFNELKIPVETRGAVPVICDGEGVIGVYGHCVDERVRIDKHTKTVLLVKVTTEDKR